LPESPPSIPAPVSVPLAELRSHPRNYRTHPDDQLDHLAESIRRNGLYRNVVAARDGTVLAGHGVVAAAARLGYTELPVVRLDLDPLEPRALKILAGDNEIAHLGEVDDRALSEILKEIQDRDTDLGLLGTGYDAAMLANLVFVTRPQSEIADRDEAALWAGMPAYDPDELDAPVRLLLLLRSTEDRAEVARLLGLALTDKTRSTWWPPKEREDMAAVRLVSDGLPV